MTINTREKKTRTHMAHDCYFDGTGFINNHQGCATMDFLKTNKPHRTPPQGPHACIDSTYLACIYPCVMFTVIEALITPLCLEMAMPPSCTTVWATTNWPHLPVMSYCMVLCKGGRGGPWPSHPVCMWMLPPLKTASHYVMLTLIAILTLPLLSGRVFLFTNFVIIL